MTGRTRLVKDVLWAIALAGLVAAVLRLWFGLGATTNLSDAVPWGLWKVLNMIAGVALSTSGFTVGFLVYVLRMERFRPFLKPAILLAFLGYGCSCTALLFDIGLPFRFWHPLVMWNFNSFLFEVFWCVLLYFTITAIELAPIVFERLRAERAARLLHHAAFVVVVAGVALSSLHHSSLGSLFLVTPQRLHALWYSPLLPLLFIVSAMGAGLMCVVLFTIVWGSLYPSDRVPQSSARSLASLAAGLLGAYFCLKVADLFLHGGWPALLAGTWESALYLLELALISVLPILLVAFPGLRRSQTAIGVAAASAVVGITLNRLSVGIFGYFRSGHTAYVPSLAEWMLSLGVISAAGLMFFFLAENLPVFREHGDALAMPDSLSLPESPTRRIRPMASAHAMYRSTFIPVLVIPLAFAVMFPRESIGLTSPTPAPKVIGADLERTRLELRREGSSIRTLFPHAEHVKRIGGSTSCVGCHHVSLPGDRSTSCVRCHQQMNAPSRIFDHESHMRTVARHERLNGVHASNYSCLTCHAAGKPKSGTTAKPCIDCHRDDMFLSGRSNEKLAAVALPFRDAMHRTCVGCHKAEAVKRNKPDLDECKTCHDSLRARTSSAPAQII